jgi:hypothetical protein
MQISTKGFKEAVLRLRELSNVAQTEKFRGVLVTALEPVQAGVIANIHSVTGKTASAVVLAAGNSLMNPSAYVKVDKKVAHAMWKGKPFPYPYVVESQTHFFLRAVEANRSRTRGITREGIADLLRPYQTTMSIGGEFFSS